MAHDRSPCRESALRLLARAWWDAPGVLCGVLGLGAWCGRRWEGVRPTLVLGRWGVAAVAGYIGLCLVCQTVAQYLLARTLGRRWPPSSVWQRCRCGWGPVRWRGIAVTRSSYLVSHVTLVPRPYPRQTSSQRPRHAPVHALGPLVWCAFFGPCPLSRGRRLRTTAHRSCAMLTYGHGRWPPPAPVGPRRTAQCGGPHASG